MSVDVKQPPFVRRPVGASGRAEIGPLVVRGDIDRLAAQLTALGHTNATVEARALVDAFWRAVPAPGPKHDLDKLAGREMVAGAFAAAPGRTVVGRLVAKPHGDAHLKALRKVARTTADPELRRLLMQTGMRHLPDELRPTDAPSGLVTGKLTRVGDSLGISPGGVFVDESGARFYAKRSVVGGERHLREELATVRFYEAAGANVIHQHLVTDADGAPFLLSRMIALHDISLDDAAQHPGMRAHFALDALLANWDVIGATSVHNVAKEAEGNLVRTEGGAGMRLSGLGDDDHFTAGFKFGAEVIDLDSLRTPPTRCWARSRFATSRTARFARRSQTSRASSRRHASPSSSTAPASSTLTAASSSIDWPSVWARCRDMSRRFPRLDACGRYSVGAAGSGWR